MDILQIPNGGNTGMRLFGDDFEYMQNGLRNAINGIYGKFIAANGGKIIINGCIPTPTGTVSQYSISGGWVFLDGTLAYFAGDTVTLSGVIDFANIELELYTYDYPSSVAVRDVQGVAYNPWKRTEARLKTTSPSTIHLGDSNRLERVMRDVISGTTTVVADSLTLTNGVTVAANTDIRLSKEGKKAYLSATLVHDPSPISGVNGVAVIATLPTGFAPKSDFHTLCVNNQGGFNYVVVQTDGQIVYTNREATDYAGLKIWFNFHYFTA